MTCVKWLLTCYTLLQLFAHYTITMLIGASLVYAHSVSKLNEKPFIENYSVVASPRQTYSDIDKEMRSTIKP